MPLEEWQFIDDALANAREILDEIRKNKLETREFGQGPGKASPKKFRSAKEIVDFESKKWGPPSRLDRWFK